MKYGWDHGKFVQLVMDENRLIARISMKEDEAQHVAHIIKRGLPDTGTVYEYKNHEQIT